MPNTRRPSRRNGGEVAPCHGYADWTSIRETQIACLVQDNGEIIGLAHDCVGFLSDLLVGLEELWCQHSWRFCARSLQTPFAGNQSLRNDRYFDVVIEL